ncbi:MAG: DNA mismatch repair endonuclease MutL [Clostridia bacterium]|nr:DNA mismatch repair endonuclease MutL [Clostridia bacterium]
MGVINILDISVANMIAAGEVVERPASVAKELIENSVDAGAKNITVEIQKGGIAFIRVTDDGCGMSREDLVLSVKRHATSKIKDKNDLAAITTLGFRGEALAATASVSNMRIMTKRREDFSGAVIRVDGGETRSVEETGCPDGTTVIVENLFYNVPARLKFLKRDITEGSAVAAVVEKAAMSHPDIAFRLISDGNMKLSTSGDGKLLNTLCSLFGSAAAKGYLPVKGSDTGIKAEGYISFPEQSRANRNGQNFFVSKRYIKSRTMSAALENAYSSFIQPDRFPACVLNFDIDPARVDVNVHPAKLEVKFADEKLVYDTLYYAVRGALKTMSDRPVLDINTAERQRQAEKAKITSGFMPIFDVPKDAAVQRKMDFSETPAVNKSGFSDRLPGGFGKRSGFVSVASPSPFEDRKARSDGGTAAVLNKPESGGVPAEPPAEKPDEKPAFAFGAFAVGEPKTDRSILDIRDDRPDETASFKPSPDGKNPAVEASAKPEFRYIGEAFDTYVIMETDGKIVIFDKHAAHERILFEELAANMDSEADVQLMLPPEKVVLGREAASAADECRGQIESVGFDFSINGDTAEICGVPAGLSGYEAVTLFSELVGSLSESSSVEGMAKGRFEKSLYTAACKAAIKGGRKYEKEFVMWLCEKLVEHGCVKYCPHGRPVAMEISKRELDRRFGRT